MLSSRLRRLKVVRSMASAMKTPTWKATQNQMFVDTAQSVPCPPAARNGKAFFATDEHGFARIKKFQSLFHPCQSVAKFQFPLANRSLLRSLFDPVMDAELEKLVEAGKLTARQADQLELLRPGTFCLHKSWGFGRVAEWNLLLNQILIDFPAKKAHPMQLGYAADNLTPLSAEHLLARKATNLAAVKELLKSDPAAVVRNVLERLGGSATVQQISQMMIGDLFNEAEWKRWWSSATKAIKKDGFFHLPAKKTEPIQLRGEKVSRPDELIAFFNQARQPKEQVAALDQIIKFHNEFDKPETQLQPIVTAIENAAARNQRLNAPLAFELVIGRDDLLARYPNLKTTNLSLTLPKLILDEQARLVTILPKLPSGKEKKVLQTLPAALGETWTTRALQLLQSNHARAVQQLPRVFAEEGKQDELRAFLERGMRDHSLTSE